MKVLLVTGSYPPMACGVGDYTSILRKHLKDIYPKCEVYFRDSWRLLEFPNIIRDIRRMSPNVIEIQYPTIRYKSNLTPQLLTLFFKRSVVMLHEVITAHPLRKLALYPFFIFADWIVLSNEQERKYALKLAPWIQKKSSVIPIGCNIPESPIIEKPFSKEVVHFGLIRPNKGLEEVLELARIFAQNDWGFTVHIVGKPHPNWPDYLSKLRAIAEKLPVKWSIDATDDIVTSILQRARFGYVPFPDGASERRASLLALLNNGIATVTTRGRNTPESISKVVRFASSPMEAAEHFKHLNENPVEILKLSKAGRNYASNYSWQMIALKHAELFSSLVERCCK